MKLATIRRDELVDITTGGVALEDATRVVLLDAPAAADDRVQALRDGDVRRLLRVHLTGEFVEALEEAAVDDAVKDVLQRRGDRIAEVDELRGDAARGVVECLTQRRKRLGLELVEGALDVADSASGTLGHALGGAAHLARVTPESASERLSTVGHLRHLPHGAIRRFAVAVSELLGRVAHVPKVGADTVRQALGGVLHVAPLAHDAVHVLSVVLIHGVGALLDLSERLSVNIRQERGGNANLTHSPAGLLGPDVRLTDGLVLSAEELLEHADEPSASVLDDVDEVLDDADDLLQQIPEALQDIDDSIDDLPERRTLLVEPCKEANEGSEDNDLPVGDDPHCHHASDNGEDANSDGLQEGRVEVEQPDQAVDYHTAIGGKRLGELDDSHAGLPDALGDLGERVLGLAHEVQDLLLALGARRPIGEVLHEILERPREVDRAGGKGRDNGGEGLEEVDEPLTEVVLNLDAVSAKHREELLPRPVDLGDRVGQILHQLAEPTGESSDGVGGSAGGVGVHQCGDGLLCRREEDCLDVVAEVAELRAKAIEEQDEPLSSSAHLVELCLHLGGGGRQGVEVGELLLSGIERGLARGLVAGAGLADGGQVVLASLLDALGVVLLDLPDLLLGFEDGITDGVLAVDASLRGLLGCLGGVGLGGLLVLDG